MKGVNVGGKNSNNLRYADDTALLTGNEKELSELSSKINEVGKQCGKKIKDEYRPRNSETIQDEEITISRRSYKT